MPGLTSEVTTQQEQRVVRRIPAGAILTLAMLGVTERGPLTTAQMVVDFTEYGAVFGGYTLNSDVATNAKSFFDNGGARLLVGRTVHFTDVSDPTTKTSAAGTLTLLTAAAGATSGQVTGTTSGPWALMPGDDLDVVVNGGAPASATFNAAAAVRTAATTGPYALSNGQTLTVKIDGGAVQTITFATGNFVAIGAATAAEVAAVISAGLAGALVDVNANAPRITSETVGTASHVEVTGGTANGALGFATAVVNGTGNVARIAAVTFAEAKAIIEAAVVGTLVTSSSGRLRIATTTAGAGGAVQVNASSTADDEFGLDNASHAGAAAGAQSTLTIDGKTDGSYTGALTIQIAAAASSAATDFNLNVLKNGVATERWPSVNFDPTSKRYVETVINDPLTGSNLITVTDLESTVDPPGNVPAVGTFGPMTGGSDGLTSLADADFTGGAGSNGSTGLRLFDQSDDIDVLCVPGRATSAVHNGMITYCDITREGLIFAVLDPPAGYSGEQMDTYTTDTAGLFGLTENAAIYWPRIKVANPQTAIYGNDKNITIPPSGMIAGIYARNDGRKVGGAFEQPAGVDDSVLPKNVTGLETDEVKKKPVRERIFPHNINPISKENGLPIFLDGARNLNIQGNWPSIGQRRGVMFVEKRLRPGLAFMRHRNIKNRLYEEGKMAVQLFLLELCKNDALASKVPSEAFSVDFGEGLNPASVKAQRTVKARVGLATSVPAEFINILIGPDNEALEAELAALAA
jgi:hypothetical protein